MKRLKVLSVLLICVLIMVTVAVISRKIAHVELTRSAFQEAEMENERFEMVTNATLLSTEWAASSFLSAYLDITSYSDDQNSSYTLSSDNFGTIDIDRLYRGMQSFLAYNNGIYSCIMTFEPGIIAGAPHGISAAMYSGSNERFNLLDEKDIFNTRFYRQVAESGKPFAKDGVVSGSILVWTLGVPIFDENGSLVGECWIDLLESTLSKQLLCSQPSRNFISFIVNKDYRAIACSDTSMNNKILFDYPASKDDDFNFEDWISGVKGIMEGDGKGWFVSDFSGSTMITFISKLEHTDYHLVSIKRGGSIDMAVKKILRRLMTVSGIGIILLALGLTYLLSVFKKQDDKERQMKGELDVASRIQRSILPKNVGSQGLPVGIYGFQRPAKSVGGDLYDYFLRDDKLYFCIGDVSGKGVPASLMMSEICSLYRFISKKREDVSDIVKTLNSAAMEHSDESMMCTMFVGILDLKTGRLDWCNAGHNPPIMIYASDRKPEFMNIKANMPLLSFEKYDYKPGHINLSHGDRLFLYTDGITESYNPRKQQFLGNEATLEILRRHKEENLQQLAESVLDEIGAFMQDAEQNDDITILCIEYENHS